MAENHYVHYISLTVLNWLFGCYGCNKTFI